ncbi:glutamate-5-semialdehyde dehydrogenase [Pseudenhygromyxa sp. WMMC2535]|uniref:glutamate-5-semialdehyde dehydrogenase n=1 Tax=Pseudenhygromyxa sp. WMMC2535 TaxID=2712867 RepID=UPI001555AA5B|nr:glutamate-5-semialdehyde dehydrogenase [Pseudenhygromyxa sp. WMMC2535]NVB43029.1 glutamate-5-semialdehyde dehydrogenase [Pseudenhygromyxa sp. WMMC2535]
MNTTPTAPATAPLSSVQARAAAARQAGRALASLAQAPRGALLEAIADALEAPQTQAEIAAANALDLAEARAAQARGELSEALVARLKLGPDKLAGLADGLRQLAAMPALVGIRQLERELDDGLILERISCPLGVLGVVFEARPDAVVQISGLALKSGNAVVLKGGSEALRSNRAVVAVIHRVIAERDLDPACVVLLEDRPAFAALLECEREIDLIIARGSGAFVQRVMDTTKIPVLGHAEGLCHLYIHADADPQRAAAIAVDAKCSYPAACNAIETLLWQRGAEAATRAALLALRERGVALRGDSASAALLDAGEVAAADEGPGGDWDLEYGDMILALRRVDDLDAALAHIEAHGSRHTEAIVCADDSPAAARFVAEVDAACVFVNASTRFADGYRFGLGAEVGIATGKLHARGPVGVEGLLTYRWLLRGHGQVSADYGPGKRSFTHRDR